MTVKVGELQLAEPCRSRWLARAAAETEIRANSAEVPLDNPDQNPNPDSDSDPDPGADSAPDPTLQCAESSPEADDQLANLTEP